MFRDLLSYNWLIIRSLHKVIRNNDYYDYHSCLSDLMNDSSCHCTSKLNGTKG